MHLPRCDPASQVSRSQADLPFRQRNIAFTPLRCQQFPRAAVGAALSQSPDALDDLRPVPGLVLFDSSTCNSCRPS